MGIQLTPAVGVGDSRVSCCCLLSLAFVVNGSNFPGSPSDAFGELSKLLLEELNLCLWVHLSLCIGLALVDLGLLRGLELFQGSNLNCGSLGNIASWLVIAVVATLHSISKGGGLLAGGDGGHSPRRNALLSALVSGSLLFLLGHTFPNSSHHICSWFILIKLLLRYLCTIGLALLGVVLGLALLLSRRLGIGLGVLVRLSGDCSHRPIGPRCRCIQSLERSYLPSQESCRWHQSCSSCWGSDKR
jgi:hypothetical protein